MRLIKNRIDVKTHSGECTLMPEDSEDMWHIYNLLAPGDLLRASALRKVSLETAGGVTQKRVHTSLTIKITRVDFDPGAAQLHVQGTVAVENEYVGLGQHHTLDLELQRNFTLSKEDGWDSVAVQILRESTDTLKKAVLWAVVMQEGLASICHITEHTTVLKQKIEVAVPRKRLGSATDHDKGMERFYATVLATLLRQIDLSDTSTPLLLASPGFVAASFQKYMKRQATATNNKPLMQLQPSILVTHTSSGHIHSLNEALASQGVARQLSDTKFMRETKLMDRFFEMIRKDDGRAWYGPREVERAVEKGAVGRGGGILLINDTLFRAQNVAERKRWVSLVDRVAEVEGGEVRKLSSMHESGKRLESLGNVAAILTFALEDLDEEDEGDGEDQHAGNAVDTEEL